jgi:hypothetical protein
MSAVLTRRRPSRARDRDREAGRSAARQEALFGGGGAVAASPPPPGPAVEQRPRDVAPAAPASHPFSGPTLDDAISALWGELVSGETTSCPACGSAAMQPRHSAGAGVVGGRCAACEATLA